MALKNTDTGVYHKIYDTDQAQMLETDRVLMELWESETHRADGTSQFHNCDRKHVSFGEKTIQEIMMEYTNNEELSAEDNFKTAVYTYIKTLDEYAGFDDA